MGPAIAALTGGIGAGKSTIAELLAQRGAVVIDVDAIGRSVLERDGGAYEQVVAEFGPSILDAADHIDRSKLAKLVFGNADNLRRLTDISHPAINAELVRRLDLLGPDAIVILDMAILAEGDLGRPDPDHSYGLVITVEAPLDARVERAKARGMAEGDVRARIAAQATDAERAALADVVIVNDGSMAALADDADRVWAQLLAIRQARG
jgi:dephospho-CoA kinase